jgi:hypothetical protein
MQRKKKRLLDPFPQRADPNPGVQSRHPVDLTKDELIRV